LPEKANRTPAPQGSNGFPTSSYPLLTNSIRAGDEHLAGPVHRPGLPECEAEDEERDRRVDPDDDRNGIDQTNQERKREKQHTKEVEQAKRTAGTRILADILGPILYIERGGPGLGLRLGSSPGY